MIKFNKIEITSFKSIFYACLDFNEIQGKFYSLEGKNNTVDFALSNGSGKSTLCDAVAYALYGTTAGIYLKKEDYQNKNSNIPMKLKLDFTIIGTNSSGNYIIERSLNDTILYFNGENISELNKTETEKKLQKILNLTKEEFFNFTYLTQGAGNFLSKTASEKMNILKDFLFGEELLQIKSKLDELIKTLKTELQNNKVQFSKIEGSLESLRKIKENSIYDSNIYDVSEEDVNSNKQELVKLKQNQNTQKKLEKDVIKFNLEFESLCQKMSKLKSQFITAKTNICPTCKQILPVSNDVVITLQNEAKDIKEKAKEIKYKKEQTETELKTYKNLDTDILELTKLIQKQEINIEKNKTLKTIDNDINKKEELIAELQTKIDELEINVKQLVSLQKYFNTTFVQYVQQAFLSEIENYLNLYCYEVFNSDFSLKFTNNNLELSIGDKPYSYFSGGERQRIDFLFVFAIKVALSNFTDKCTNLLIFDESLSGSDSIAFEKSVELIDRLSASSELTTILVSHRENSLLSTNRIILNRFKDKTKLNVVTV